MKIRGRNPKIPIITRRTITSTQWRSNNGSKRIHFYASRVEILSHIQNLKQKRKIGGSSRLGTIHTGYDGIETARIQGYADGIAGYGEEHSPWCWLDWADVGCGLGWDLVEVLVVLIEDALEMVVGEGGDY